MKPTLFETAIALIDEKNSEDINSYQIFGLKYPKEILYAKRMSKKLLEFDSNASEALQIAARAQHICRWKIVRNQYPTNRIGYLKWRETLKKMHAEITGELLLKVGYSTEFIANVKKTMLKKQLKKNKESQTLEDVACLVFLAYYFEEFAAKHTDEKVIAILKKTWVKMSDKGQEFALKIPFSKKSMAFIKKAITFDF